MIILASTAKLILSDVMFTYIFLVLGCKQPPDPDTGCILDSGCKSVVYNRPRPIELSTIYDDTDHVVCQFGPLKTSAGGSINYLEIRQKNHVLIL